MRTIRERERERSERSERLERSERPLDNVLVDDLGDFLLLLRSAKPLDLQHRLVVLLEYFLAIEALHLLVVANLFGRQRLLARGQLLFAGVLRDAELVEIRLLALSDGLGVEDERVVLAREVDFLAAREDLVAAVLLVPLRERRRHVHLLDDVPPADAGVIRAEGDLPFLRRIRNDAALRAPEVVVEEILEPHARDEQEVPAVAAAHHLIVDRPVAADAP